jgi:hypothetical protein
MMRKVRTLQLRTTKVKRAILDSFKFNEQQKKGKGEGPLSKKLPEA